MDSQTSLILHLCETYAHARAMFTEFCKTNLPVRISSADMIVWITDREGTKQHRFWSVEFDRYRLQGMQIDDLVAHGKVRSGPVWTLALSRIRQTNHD